MKFKDQQKTLPTGGIYLFIYVFIYFWTNLVAR